MRVTLLLNSLILSITLNFINNITFSLDLDSHLPHCVNENLAKDRNYQLNVTSSDPNI